MSYYFPLHRLSSIYTDHRGFRRLKCTIYTHLQCRRNIQIHIFIDWWGIQLLIVGLLWTWRHIYANNMDAFIQALGSLNICCCTSVAKSPSSWEKAMLRWHLLSTMVERWTDGRDLAITQEKLSQAGSVIIITKPKLTLGCPAWPRNYSWTIFPCTRIETGINIIEKCGMYVER